MASVDAHPRIEVATKEKDKGPVEKEEVAVDEFVEVRGWKALGNKLSSHKVVEVKTLASKPVEKPQEVKKIPIETEGEPEHSSEEKVTEEQDDTAPINQLDLFG
ncbi:hypothetical protein [Siphonobacter sp.]|uniref:hypothetical protein n=1 Tax=Siphonobacter sp. TaxID=1869184 RepID=UPI003B3BD34F